MQVPSTIFARLQLCHGLILYDCDSNIILFKPLKTRQGASKLTTTWTSLHDQLQSNGYAPELHILDNECSDKLKKAFKKYSVAFQRVPPHVHQCNAAERAIQTWKYHFCSGLATCDPKLPLTELDLLMSQADITLNLLRPSYRQPNLSVYACLNGTFNFSHIPCESQMWWFVLIIFNKHTITRLTFFLLHSK